MSVLASAVMLESAAVYLNDAAQADWTNTVLLPLLKKANIEMGQEFRVNGIDTLKKAQSPVTSVEIDDTELDEYPSDFVEPISLFERTLSSSEYWGSPITRVDNVDKDIRLSQSIIQWSWQNNKIYINPPQTNRETYLVYIRNITAIADASTAIEFDECKTFLAARTAQLAYLGLGNNATRATELSDEVERSKDRLIRYMLNNQQGLGVRRRGFKGLR